MTPADQASVRVDWGLPDGNGVVCHTVRVVIQKLHLLKDRVILKGRNKIQRVEISVNGVKYYGGLNDLPGRIRIVGHCKSSQKQTKEEKYIKKQNLWSIYACI